MFNIIACNNLDLNPLSEGSSENWYSTEDEIAMAIKDLYRLDFWTKDADSWTDNWTERETTTAITNATIDSQSGIASSWWTLSYKAIARANTILLNLDKGKVDISKEKLDKFKAEARFLRACQYSNLISHFGDVVYYTDVLDLEKSFTLSRTDKNIILKAIYDDYDFAASKLPTNYGSSELKRATKGAALAMKARIALYMGDWTIARDAAKACIDLGVYKLYSDFGTLFLSKTRNTEEAIFSIPRSVALGISQSGLNVYIPRNAGGLGLANPSWDLFCSFLCSDGLPIDKSSLYNPREPFKNRDPRCNKTIVEFQSAHLGFIYQPHPDSLKILNLNTGKYQTNNDNRAVIQYASYNGLLWKKGIDLDWSDDFKTETEQIIVRYADVLLMFAEAKIELKEIDQSVLDAINQVRARAYGVTLNQTNSYPAVTTTDQVALRKTLRVERRMEFAWEGLRYMDIIRWKLADKVLNNPIYGMLDPAELKSKIVNMGLWFFPQVPAIDEDGIADFTAMYNAGLIKRLAVRKFDASKQYLWPIPSKEILINSNLKQNPGY